MIDKLCKIIVIPFNFKLRNDKDTIVADLEAIYRRSFVENIRFTNKFYIYMLISKSYLSVPEIELGLN